MAWIPRIAASVALASVLAWGGSAAAQTGWAPGKSARIVVPFPAGGAADFLARLLAQQITAASGQGMLIENRPGGGTVIGTEVVARATPDGTTMLLMANSFVINPGLRASLPYDPQKSFEPLCLLAGSPLVLAVNSKSPFKTFAAYRAAAADKPGTLNLAAVGPATVHHVAIETLKRAAKMDVTFVPFPGGAPSVTNLLGGHVSAALANHAEVKENLGTNLTAIAVGTPQRLKDLPDVPTLAELGFPEVIGVAWFGLVAPAGTPAPVVGQIIAQTKAAIATPEISAKITAAGLIPEGLCGAPFADMLKSQQADYARAIKDANIKE